MSATYGWKGTGAEFLAEASVLSHRVAESYEDTYLQSPAGSQRTAWTSQIAVLARAFDEIAESRDWGLVIEYELPFEGGRRVDKIALAGRDVAALEFKEARRVLPADLDQVRAYARDLAEYHSECRDRSVHPVLVLPNAGALDDRIDDTRIVGPDRLPGTLTELIGTAGAADVDRWLAGTYAPLPSLVEAARRVFQDEPLPQIHRAESAGVPALLRWLHELVLRAEATHERHVVLLTGVPGSGKTLVGLQFVHEYGPADEAPAIFLSGNGPLVALLQYVLASKVFVRPIRQFMRYYGLREDRVPAQHVFVFDEAQRMWDREYVVRKHGRGQAEPEMILDVASRVPDWAVVVGLVGEGQEIHLGEEAGVGQWNDAVRTAAQPFDVHIAPRLRGSFPTGQPEPALDLTLTLRTHRASHTSDWVSYLMAGDIVRANQVGATLEGDGYDLYVTTDLDLAKAYLGARYADAPEKRYGLIASSKARNLPELGVDNTYFATQRMHVGKWFGADRGDPESCCRFLQPATEFQCQGLELDLPIVCWGDDLQWIGKWKARRVTRGARDSEQLRINSYRVLLTRGRDGTVVYVPSNLADGQAAGLISVFEQAGARRLRSP